MTREPFLSIDIGNTTVVIGLLAGDTVREVWRLSSFVGRTGDEIVLALRQFLDAYRDELDAPGSVGIASVVPELTRPFATGCARLFGHEPVIVTSDLDLGFDVRYLDASQIGPDRLANVAAVHAGYRTPAIVVDLGTTTNFDVIAADGAFEGGAIAPGYFTTARDLFRRAARLPQVELGAPSVAIGRTTVEAIRAGVVYGTVGLIDGIVDRIRAELPGDPIVIATGGLAETITGESRTIEIVDSELTLKGVRILSLRARLT